MRPFGHFSPTLGLLLVFILQFSILSLSAAEPVDLGQNLTYLRLHRLPDDLPALAAAWTKPALIIDLRHTAGDGAKILADALPARPGLAPLFVLIGPATPVDAIAVLRTRAPALITLGLPAPGLAPDIAPTIQPEDDLRAYEALEAGAAIESLINEKPAGQRFDEAALVHKRVLDSNAEEQIGATGENAPNARAPVAPPAAASDARAGPATPPKELKDLVLQRAVQLQRALLALGKLPRAELDPRI